MELFLTQRTDLFDGRPKSLLHIAPEPVFARRFKAIPELRYVSMDIESARRPSVLADITRLPFASASFDVIYCSHVLEHIPDDRAAMRELRRTLKPSGWSILQVPLREGRVTYEDPSITTPEARLAAFGQHDHVRDYGDKDYGMRLDAAGFAVTADDFVRRQSAGDQKRFGLMAWEDVYVCRPRAEA
jgi:SAM-dependent methyltransferase